MPALTRLLDDDFVAGAVDLEQGKPFQIQDCG